MAFDECFLKITYGKSGENFLCQPLNKELASTCNNLSTSSGSYLLLAATQNGELVPLALKDNAHITVSRIPGRCLGCCDLKLGSRVRVEWVQHLGDLLHPFLSQGPALLTRRLLWIRCLVSQKCQVLSPRTFRRAGTLLSQRRLP